MQKQRSKYPPQSTRWEQVRVEMAVSRTKAEEAMHTVATNTVIDLHEREEMVLEMVRMKEEEEAEEA